MLLIKYIPITIEKVFYYFALDNPSDSENCQVFGKHLSQYLDDTSSV